ncbi:MAG: tRNA lysidine(34) synthetase TilS [Bacteroidetes bacterium]|nr:tRNA lysidine(34) synthetase TilS [Bacteroidota bacterium]
MLEAFKNCLDRHDLDSRDQVLLAISGGLDSCVLLRLLLDLGFLPQLAHVNFQLRGAQSNADEAFCKSLARQHNLRFHSLKVDTLEYAQKHGLSSQMAARELRYQFFEDLDAKHQYRAILTGHHGDDQIETMLYKLARGSALEAVAGIREKREKYLRPMLGILRKDLETFAKAKKLEWREDISNADTRYLRNAYRHRLIPMWEEIQADFKRKLIDSSQLLRQQSDALEALISEKLQEVLEVEEDCERLHYGNISSKSYFQQVLFQWLRAKGSWDWEAVNQLWRSAKGRFTENDQYSLSQGGGFYELRPVEKALDFNIEIGAQTTEIEEPMPIAFEFLKREGLKIDGNPNHLFLDADLLRFPLKLRPYREGDRFQPLGMSGTKKLSDYWIDIKLNRSQKKQQLVLLSDGEIVGLIGHRIDHRYRIKNSTKTVYFVRLKK